MIHCPTCAGGLRFDIETQSLLCDHCGNSYLPESIRDDTKDDAKSASCFDGYVYVCPSCGGELMTVDKNDAVGFCPYCGGASMIFDKVRKEWAPEYVIPFSITKEQCKQLYINEVKKHPFVSKKYRDPQLIESFRGIYMPYWNYVAEQKGTFKVEATGKEKYVGSSTYEKDVYEVSGEMDMTVEGFTHDASASFDDSLSEGITPFYEDKRKPFMPGYLCGFYAEIADVSADAFTSMARDELESYSIKALQNDAGIADVLVKNDLVLSSSNTTVPIKITSAKRVLRPVWFMSYRNENKITYAVVNGQTGKLQADLPLSPARILIAALLGAGILFGLFLLGMSFLPSIKPGPTLGIGILLMLVGLFYTRKSFCFSMNQYYSGNIGVPDEFIAFSEVAAIVLAVLGLIIINSDGSFKGTARGIGNILLIPSLIFLIVKYVKQNYFFKLIKKHMKQTPQDFRMGTVPEAQRYLRREGWLRIVCYVTMIFAFALVVVDPAQKAVMYSVGILLMAELFGLVLNTVYFQSQVAKRMPPQFNKKGALYDEK